MLNGVFSIGVAAIRESEARRPQMLRVTCCIFVVWFEESTCYGETKLVVVGCQAGQEI